MSPPRCLLAILAEADEAGCFHMETADRGVLSVGDLRLQARRAAGRLAVEGIGPRDVVLYQGTQGPEALVLFWASVLLGAVFAPVDHAWPEYLIRRVTPALKPRLTLSAPANAGIYRELFPAARHISLAAGESGADEWNAWLAGALQMPELVDADVGEDAPAAYLFTSGSTDLPKAVVLSRGALAHGARLTVDCFEWRAAEVLVNLPEPHTMSGLRNGFIAAVAAGAHLRVLDAAQRSNIFDLVEALTQTRCERLVAGPLLIRQLVVLAERLDPETFAHLRVIYCTGATLSPAAVRAFHARFGIPIINYYGLTETGGICVSQRIAGWEPDDSSLGAAAGAELRVVDGEGPPRPHGLGELQVRSPQLMSCYLGDPERTAARFAEGWLKTGDRVRIDADGRCYLVGRLDGFLKTASTDRVAPEEVEAVLEEHPAVAEAAVIGVGDGEAERIVALVVFRTGAAQPLLSDVAAFVRDRLGAARTPTRIVAVDGLPRRENGKLIRGELRGLLGDL